MSKIVFFVFIICGLSLASGERPKDMDTETASHRRNGEISADDIDRILKRLEDSETLTQQLLDRVEQLESRDQLQQEENRSLKIELEFFKRRARSQMLRNRHISARRHLKLHGNMIERNDEAYKVAPSSEIARLRNTEQQHRIRQVEDTQSHVAFMASMTHHQKNIAVNQSVIFDNVISNIGGGYHSDTSSFIAPRHGTYVLSTTLLLWPNMHCQFAFLVNGSRVTYMYVTDATSNQTVVLSLKKGDVVNIQNTSIGKSLNGNGYSIFSGFLLYDQEDPGIIG